MEDDPALLLVSQEPMDPMEEDEFEDLEDEVEEEEVKQDFLKALHDYGQKVVGISADEAMLTAMKAMTRTLKNAQRSTPHSLQQQMHCFGSRGDASRKTKTGLLMKPNPPALSARKAPGSLPAPLGRRPKDRAGEKGIPLPTPRNKRPHNLAFAVENNVPNAK